MPESKFAIILCLSIVTAACQGAGPGAATRVDEIATEVLPDDLVERSCAYQGKPVRVVGRLSFNGETSRARLHSSQKHDVSVGVEPLPEIRRKREQFDGAIVAVAGTFRCDVGLDLGPDGNRLPGLIGEVKSIEVIENPRGALDFEVKNLRRASSVDEARTRDFVSGWLTRFSGHDVSGIAAGMGDPERVAHALNRADSRESWILFEGPNSIAKRMQKSSAFCGVYEYEMVGLPFSEFAYCVDESGACGSPDASRKDHIRTWLSDGPAYCIQVGNNGAGRLWISDSSVY